MNRLDFIEGMYRHVYDETKRDRALDRFVNAILADNYAHELEIDTCHDALTRLYTFLMRAMDSGATREEFEQHMALIEILLDVNGDTKQNY